MMLAGGGGGDPPCSPEKDTIVWVDIENCGVPSDLNSTELYGLIEQKLGEDGFNRGNLVVNVVVPFLDSYVPELGPNIEIWRARNYNKPLTRRESKNKNQIADKFIKQKINEWLDSNPAPHNVMVATGDDDFRSTFNRLRKEGHTTLMAYNTKSVSGDLLSIQLDSKWDWREFLSLPIRQLSKKEKCRLKSRLRAKAFRKKQRAKRRRRWMAIKSRWVGTRTRWR
ncbi:hypothetical protein F2Q69_00044512 [Brassica cretica]|uniref:NYN domain-containing protein n=1 Tax=Brassica cretica TaxID=69181 RepID=A0A8S9N8H1_BRACR|nr:hypothetical protein F2Q69_00044512 [Brassica cretica]